MVVQVFDTKLASSPYSTCASSYQKLSYYAFAGRLVLWHIKMFHRIGQTRPVTSYRLVAKDTIEEKIVDLHKTKRALADSLLEGAGMAAKMSADDMLELLRDKWSS